MHHNLIRRTRLALLMATGLWSGSAVMPVAGAAKKPAPKVPVAVEYVIVRRAAERQLAAQRAATRRARARRPTTQRQTTGRRRRTTRRHTNAVSPAPNYHVAELKFSSPEVRCNNKGQVVGAKRSADGTWQSFLWDKGTLTSLPAGFHAYDINDQGQIVGDTISVSTGADGKWLLRAALWDKGKVIQLGTLHQQYSNRATAINNRSQIVGYSFDGTHQMYGFLWESGKMRALATSTAQDADQGFVPRRINDKGEIIGTGMSPTTKLVNSALLWANGQVTDLGGFANQDFSIPNAINNQSEVVGYTTPSRPGYERAYVWRDGKLTALETLEGSNGSVAEAVNDQGEVVGHVNDINGDHWRAVLWYKDKVYDLNELLAAPTPAPLEDARAINNNGQIVCVANSRVYVLTPLTVAQEKPANSGTKKKATKKTQKKRS